MSLSFFFLPSIYLMPRLLKVFTALLEYCIRNFCVIIVLKIARKKKARQRSEMVCYSQCIFFLNDACSICPAITHPLQSIPPLFHNSYHQVLMLILTPLTLLQHLYFDERKWEWKNCALGSNTVFILLNFRWPQQSLLYLRNSPQWLKRKKNF